MSMLACWLCGLSPAVAAFYGILVRSANGDYPPFKPQMHSLKHASETSHPVTSHPGACAGVVPVSCVLAGVLVRGVAHLTAAGIAWRHMGYHAWYAMATPRTPPSSGTDRAHPVRGPKSWTFVSVWVFRPYRRCVDLDFGVAAQRAHQLVKQVHLSMPLVLPCTMVRQASLH